MALTKTPICNFGEKAKNFNLLSTENKKISLDNVRGKNGTLVMFICNHCPYVKAIIKDLVSDIKFLEGLGIRSVGIMSNDVRNYPDDSFENMISFSKMHAFSFSYLIDETQSVAKEYGAVCTPDFFGYNKNLELQYRGRIRELKDLKPVRKGDSDLKVAMKLVAELVMDQKIKSPAWVVTLNGLNNVSDSNKKLSAGCGRNASVNGRSIRKFTKSWTSQSIYF